MRSVLHAQPWLAVADINSMLRGTRKDDINLSPVDDMSECWGEPIAAGPNHLLSTCSFCTWRARHLGNTLDAEVLSCLRTGHQLLCPAEAFAEANFGLNFEVQGFGFRNVLRLR